MRTTGGNNQPLDESGSRAIFSKAIQVNAGKKSELFLATGSKSNNVKGGNTITVGKGSYLRLAAGSTLAHVPTTDIKRGRLGLWTALFAGLVVFVIGVTLVVLSFDKELGPVFIVVFGAGAVLGLFIKEACTTFSKESSFSDRAIDNLVKTAAIASIFAVAFGAPAAAWTIKKAYSVAVEEGKANSDEPAVIESASATPTPTP